MNEALLVECARWIYENKKKIEKEGREVWWTPYSLTNLSLDKTNPNICINDAFEVFMELVRRRLASHEFVMRDEKPFPVFILKQGKEKEWEKLVSKKSKWDLYILPSLIWLAKKTWLVGLFILGTLGTFYLNHFASKSVEPEKEALEYNIQLNEEQLEKLLLSLENQKGQLIEPPETQEALEGSKSSGQNQSE